MIQGRSGKQLFLKLLENKGIIIGRQKMDNTKAEKYNTKSMSVLMNTIDLVLEDIVWVNKDSDVVNLKQVLSNKTTCKNTGCIESLPYEDLIGAYTCLQIRNETFNDDITNQDNKEIANKIKTMIFTEARNKLIEAGLCKVNSEGKLICKNKKIAV